MKAEAVVAVDPAKAGCAAIVEWTDGLTRRWRVFVGAVPFGEMTLAWEGDSTRAAQAWVASHVPDAEFVWELLAGAGVLFLKGSRDDFVRLGREAGRV